MERGATDQHGRQSSIAQPPETLGCPILIGTPHGTGFYVHSDPQVGRDSCTFQQQIEEEERFSASEVNLR
jgi:hypothetical protein